MGYDTKPNLDYTKFEQRSGDTLNLSGTTKIYKNFVIESGATFTVKGNAGDCKMLMSDSVGNITLQEISDSNIVHGSNIYTSLSNPIGITTGLNNTFFGDSSGNALTSGCNNIGIGSGTLCFNTTGNNNIAFGVSALASNISGCNNIGIGGGTLCFNTTGNNNIATGCGALFYNTTGQYNIAMGYQALNFNTTGNDNIAMGDSALRCRMVGDNSIAIGRCAMYLSFSGSSNIGIGYKSLFYGVNDNNVGIGESTLGLLCNGSNNVAIGYYAQAAGDGNNDNIAIGTCSLFVGGGLGSVAIGTCALSINNENYNTAIGYYAMNKANAGECNTAIGANALRCNCAGGNVAIGVDSMQINRRGDYNVSIGKSAMELSIGGNSNSVIGSYGLYNNDGGCGNVVVGSSGLYNNCSGNTNVAIGNSSLYYNKNSNNNIGIGSHVLYYNYSGNNNIGVGINSLYINCSGNNNIGIGNYAGYSSVTGSSSVFLGNCAGYGETSGCRLHIGNCSTRSLIYGEFDNEKLCIRGKTYISGLTNATKSNVVYYDNSTNELSYDVAPSGTGGTSYTFNNGLTESGGNVSLGGTLSYAYIQSPSNCNFLLICFDDNCVDNDTKIDIYISNTGSTCSSRLYLLNNNIEQYVQSDMYYSYTDVFPEYHKIFVGSVQSDEGITQCITHTGMTIESTYSDFSGIQYANDYSSNYTDRSLVDKGYVISLMSGSSLTASNGLTKLGGSIVLGGALTGITCIDVGTTCNIKFVDSVGRNLSYDGAEFTICCSWVDFVSYRYDGDSRSCIASTGDYLTLSTYYCGNPPVKVNSIYLQDGYTLGLNSCCIVGSFVNYCFSNCCSRTTNYVTHSNNHYRISNPDIGLNTPKLCISGITNASKTNVLYYDTATKEVSYGTAPSGTGGTSYTFNNGLTETSGVVSLGGALIENTIISGNYSLNFCGGAKLNTVCGYQISGVTMFNTSPTTITSIFIGCNSGIVNTGSNNLGIGTLALNSNTTGCDNIAMGYSALKSNTTGLGNIAIGCNAMYMATGGQNNIAMGSSALNSNTTGQYNIAMGYSALNSNTNGVNNIAIGCNAMYMATGGQNNIAMGNYAGIKNITGSSNVFIGSYAGCNATDSNRLYIGNDISGNPLIYGEFDNKRLKVCSTLEAVSTNSTCCNTIYMGDMNSDGSWRFVVSGASMVVQRRETGSWINKQVFG